MSLDAAQIIEQFHWIRWKIRPRVVTTRLQSILLYFVAGAFGLARLSMELITYHEGEAKFCFYPSPRLSANNSITYRIDMLNSGMKYAIKFASRLPCI